MPDLRSTYPEPDIMLTAGPSVMPPEVLFAGKSRYHYDPAFLELFGQTEAMAAQVMGTSGEVVILQGEAMLGLEAAARSLVSPGMPVLNLVSGIFGQGMSEWLRLFGADVHELRVSYREAVSPAAVEEYLDEHRDTRLVCAVHCETPSATVQDVAAIGRICRERGVLTLVDSVSAAGGMPLKVDESGLDVVVAGPQKCLGAPPGLAPVAVSSRVWDVIDANPAAPHPSSYLSLTAWRDQWHGKGLFPYTPSVTLMGSFHEALRQVLDEGVANRIARTQETARICRAGVKAMGLELWPASEDIAASCVTAVRVPVAYDADVVRGYLRHHYGVMASSGQGALPVIRLAHMGAVTRPDLIAALALLGQALADLGAEIDIGAGPAAVTAAMSAGRPKSLRGAL